MKDEHSKLRAALAVLTLVGLGVAGYQYLDPKAMWQAWQKFSWDACGWLLFLPALYLLFKSLRFVVLMKPVSDAPKGQVLCGYAASQAASMLPGGVAMRAAMMHRLGVPVEDSSGPILANSAADQFVLLLSGLVLCYYYEDLRLSAFLLTGLLALLLLTLFFDRSRQALQRALMALGRRLKVEERVKDFFANISTLMSFSIFFQTMLWSILANAVSFIALCLVVDSLGFPWEPWPLAAAFVIPNLLGRLSPLPAGAGVVEAGMVGFIAAQTAMSFDQAAVATVLFRIVDIMLPAFYGGLCYLLLFKPESEQELGATA